jgi:hypothetical protein
MIDWSRAEILPGVVRKKSRPVSVPALTSWAESGEPPDELINEDAPILLLDGSGPFERDKFMSFLLFKGIDAYRFDAEETGASILILGEDGCEIEAIAKFIANRPETVRIYSQQTFVSWLLTGSDPFDLEEHDDELGGAHSAFEQVLAELERLGWLPDQFEWPVTDLLKFPGTGSAMGELSSPSVGVLRLAGYRTGTNAAGSQARQAKLRRLFESESLLRDYRTAEMGLRPGDLEAHLNTWGLPRSGVRLRKMAESIAAFCRNEKHRGLLVSPQQREDDLEWLKREFYDGKLDGQSNWWPLTRI